MYVYVCVWICFARTATATDRSTSRTDPLIDEETLSQLTARNIVPGNPMPSSVIAAATTAKVRGEERGCCSGAYPSASGWVGG